MSASLRFCAAVVLLILAVDVYLGVYGNDFVDFDDNIYITQNPYTKAGLSRSSIQYAWTTFDSGNWIPLTWLSYQLDTTLWGCHPLSYHATNVILHALNVSLLFEWLSRITQAPRRSFALAAIFAVHPLHVESVAWAAERKDVLSTFWLLVTLVAYERYSSRPSRSRYVVTIASFALGLVSKSMVVTLPILLLVLDYWPLERAGNWTQSTDEAPRYSRRTLRWLILEKLPLIALSLGDGIITMMAQNAGHIVGNQTNGSTFSTLPPLVRFANALVGYGWYLEKTVWPVGLCAFYPHPGDQVSPLRVWLSGIGLLIAGAYVAINGRRRPHLVTGSLWYLISLLPVIGLLQVGSQAYADRYSYIPHIGLLLLIGWEFHAWMARTAIGHIVALVLAGLSVMTLGAMTIGQVAVWKSTDRLWGQALDVNPDNWFAHLQLGNRRVLAGQTDDLSLRHLMIVIECHPKQPVALNNVGWIYQCRDDLETAEMYYRRAIAVDPAYSPAMQNLIVVLKKRGGLAADIDLIEQYLERNPNDAWTLNELGMLAVRSGQMEKAQSLFQKSLRVDPEQRAARVNLALALTQLGRDQEAKTHLEIAVDKFPQDADAHVNLALLLERMENYAAATQHFEEALRLNPQDREAQDHLENLKRRKSLP